MIPLKLYSFAISTLSICLGFTAVANGSYLSEDFFPLIGGSQHTYHFWGTGNEGQPFDALYIAQIQEQQVNVNGYDAWELLSWSDGPENMSAYYTVDADGIKTVQMTYRDYARPLMYLPAELLAGQTTTDTVGVSQTWEDGSFLSGNAERTVTPIGMETIQVEAGTFTALRVDWQETSVMYWTDDEVEWKEVCLGGGSFWLVEGLGLVKRTNVGSEAKYWLEGSNWIQGQTDYQNNTMELVPIPSTLFLLGSGMLGVLGLKRRGDMKH